MRLSFLSTSASLLILSLSWAAFSSSETRANQHAPLASFGQLMGQLEIVVEDVVGPSRSGAFTVIDLYTVPGDRTAVITDIQARAGGEGAFILRDGLRVAEATHESLGDVFPSPVAVHTSIASGIEFPPGSRLQLELPAGYLGKFISLRGYLATNTPRLTSIRYP